MTPSSPSDLPMTKHKPQEIVAKLRQVDVLISKGQSLADAIRQVGLTVVTFHRWPQELARQNNDQVKGRKEHGQEAPRAFVEGNVGVVPDKGLQSKTKTESIGFEE
jgi:putative transposase